MIEISGVINEANRDELLGFYRSLEWRLMPDGSVVDSNNNLIFTDFNGKLRAKRKKDEEEYLYKKRLRKMTATAALKYDHKKVKVGHLGEKTNDVVAQLEKLGFAIVEILLIQLQAKAVVKNVIKEAVTKTVMSSFKP